MMKPIGRVLAIAALLVATLAANSALGAVSVSVDRNRIAFGDTLRLTITASDNEDITDGELQPLQQDFDILQRSTSSNTSIINGRVSHSKEITVELAPRREGNLQIPPMQFGQSTTPRLTVVVGPASDATTDGQNVVFEAEVDHDEVYVQGQIILTLRVQQAVNLEGRSISPLKLEDAFVKPLEQRSFQRNIGGRPWLVDEVRYAIFPEHSGTLTIPAQVFSGRLEQGRRSFFDIGGGGQLVRRATQAISINVLPKPANYPAADWLPAQRLTLEESWSAPPENLRVGESATRTIRMMGEGLQGAQLPPILFTPIEGLKYYPDQPAISEREIPDGLEGIREDSAAVVPTRAGSYEIPEIRIPWWDTTTGTLQYAVLPQRTITASGVAPGGSSDAGSQSQAAVDPAVDSPPPVAVDPSAGPDATDSLAAQRELRLWQLLGAVSTIGWLLTFLYLRRKRVSLPPARAGATQSVSEQHAFKQLLAACSNNEPAGARAAVIAWAAALTPGAAAVSLDQVVQQLGDEELGQLLGKLDEALYRPGDNAWNGAALAECLRRLRKKTARSNTSDAEQRLQLYPTSS